MRSVERELVLAAAAGIESTSVVRGRRAVEEAVDSAAMVKMKPMRRRWRRVWCSCASGSGRRRR